MKRILLKCFTIFISVILLSCNNLKTKTSSTPGSRIDTLITDYFELNRFNGNILVAKNGEIILSKGYGYANFEWKIPNSPDTRFLIASISKTFTASLIAKLIDQGHLTLDTKLSDILHWYRKDIGNKVTVFNLLNHTSGIPDYLNLKNITFQELSREFGTSKIDKKEFAINYCSEDFGFEPGTNWAYNNSAYFLLGLIIEEKTGKPYHLALQEMIFDPLGMTSSGDIQPNPYKIIENMATGYTREDGGFNVMSYWNLSTTYAAGSLYATTGDLLKFDRALNSGSFISPQLKEAMFTPFLNGYGCGWELREKSIGTDSLNKVIQTHEGYLRAWHTRFYRIPEDGYFIVILSNTGVSPLEKMFSGITDILYGRDPQYPKPSLTELVNNELKLNGLESAIAYGKTLMQKNNKDFETEEADLNRMGYSLINQGHKEAGVTIFQWNTELYPNSWNVWDSYGEGLSCVGKKEEAIAAYKKSLELNPENIGGSKMINKLQQ